MYVINIEICELINFSKLAKNENNPSDYVRKRKRVSARMKEWNRCRCKESEGRTGMKTQRPQRPVYGSGSGFQRELLPRTTGVELENRNRQRITIIITANGTVHVIYIFIILYCIMCTSLL